MKKNILFALALSILSFSLVSCNDDDTVSNSVTGAVVLSSEDAKQTMNTTYDEFITALTPENILPLINVYGAFVDCASYETDVELFSMADVKEHVKGIMSGDINAMNKVGLGYMKARGNYTADPETKTWVRDDTNPDAVVMNFPVYGEMAKVTLKVVPKQYSNNSSEVVDELTYSWLENDSLKLTIELGGETLLRAFAVVSFPEDSKMLTASLNLGISVDKFILTEHMNIYNYSSSSTMDLVADGASILTINSSRRGENFLLNSQDPEKYPLAILSTKMSISILNGKLVFDENVTDATAVEKFIASNGFANTNEYFTQLDEVYNTSTICRLSTGADNKFVAYMVRVPKERSEGKWANSYVFNWSDNTSSELEEMDGGETIMSMLYYISNLTETYPSVLN